MVHFSSIMLVIVFTISALYGLFASVISYRQLHLLSLLIFIRTRVTAGTDYVIDEDTDMAFFGWPKNHNDDCYMRDSDFDRERGWLGPDDITCPTHPLRLINCCWCLWDQDLIEENEKMWTAWRSYEEFKARQRKSDLYYYQEEKPFKPPVIDVNTYHAPFEIDDLRLYNTRRFFDSSSSYSSWTSVSFTCRITLTLEEWAQHWPKWFRREDRMQLIPMKTRHYSLFCHPSEVWEELITSTERQYKLTDLNGFEITQVKSGRCKLRSPLPGITDEIRRIERFPEKFKKTRKSMRMQRARLKMPHRVKRGNERLGYHLVWPTVDDSPVPSQPVATKTIDPVPRPVKSKHIEVQPGDARCTELFDRSQYPDNDITIIGRAEIKNTLYDHSNQAMQWPETQGDNRLPGTHLELERGKAAQTDPLPFRLDSGLPDVFDHHWPDLDIDTGDLFQPSTIDMAVQNKFDLESGFGDLLDDTTFSIDSTTLSERLSRNGEFLPGNDDLWPELQIDTGDLFSMNRPDAAQEAVFDLTTQHFETIPPAYTNSLSIVTDNVDQNVLRNTHILRQSTGPSNRVYYDMPAETSRKRPGSDIDRNMKTANVATEWPVPERAKGSIKVCLNHGPQSSNSASFYAELLLRSLDARDAFGTLESLPGPKS